MVDLVQWLTARLDTDEQIAREATDGPWRNAPTARHHATASGRSEEAVFAALPDVGVVIVAATGEASERRNLVNAEHIAAWDPARVLREIDAKRQLVKLHGRATLRAGGGAQYYATTTVCRSCEANLQFPEESWPCTTLRLLALPYADKPGYREEWAP